jgi:hypothetical protein
MGRISIRGGIRVAADPIVIWGMDKTQTGCDSPSRREDESFGV